MLAGWRVFTHLNAHSGLAARRFSTSSPRYFQDYYLTRSLGGQLLRLNLNKSRQLLGVLSSRGTRDQNEDRYSVCTLELPPSKHMRDVPREANRIYLGIFDGHGGPLISEWLADHLHQRLESITVDAFPPILGALRKHGGYFKRLKVPPPLSEIVDSQGHSTGVREANDLTLEERLELAFLQADVECLDILRDDGPDTYHEGSTGSVAIIEPHDDRPFWDSEHYDIVVGHVGDTRILLCDATSGEVITLTTGDHHPGNPAEQDRLRKYAGFVTTDSWGDDRIMGMLATSRAFGDSKLKKYGVSAEPDLVRYTIDTQNPAAFMVMVTDGLTSVMSDQEIVDIVKKERDPTAAAHRLVDIADQYGSEDNLTAMVVRLKNFGCRMHDITRDLREYRLANASMSARQSW